jgi:1-aminocyclopropane-1-carboxylate deaminase
MITDVWQLKPEKSEVVPLFSKYGCNFSILREDLLHSDFGGNKWRKLKYNVLDAKSKSFAGIETVGGAFSNHIAATAAACFQQGLKCKIWVRGFESYRSNPTLQWAENKGAEVHFIRPELYRAFLHEKASFPNTGNWYFIPEGGSNEFALKGCEEILHENTADFDALFCGVGTGTTLSGIIRTAQTHQVVYGLPIMKKFDDQKRFIEQHTLGSKIEWKLLDDYSPLRFGKLEPEQLEFIRSFKNETSILLDPFYTSLAAFAMLDMARKGCFKPNSNILLIHTGGLQGWNGFSVSI